MHYGINPVDKTLHLKCIIFLLYEISNCSKRRLNGLLGTGSHGQKQGLKTYIVLPSPGHNHGAVLTLLTVASLTQALVWLRGEECGESTVLATPPPPQAEQLLAGVHPTWLGDYNQSCLPTMPRQCAALHYSLSTIPPGWCHSGYKTQSELHKIQPNRLLCSKKLPG